MQSELSKERGATAVRARRCWVVHRDDGPAIAIFSATGADMYREAGLEVEGPFIEEADDE